MLTSSGSNYKRIISLIGNSKQIFCENRRSYSQTYRNIYVYITNIYPLGKKRKYLQQKKEQQQQQQQKKTKSKKLKRIKNSMKFTYRSSLYAKMKSILHSVEGSSTITIYYVQQVQFKKLVRFS